MSGEASSTETKAKKAPTIAGITIKFMHAHSLTVLHGMNLTTRFDKEDGQVYQTVKMLLADAKSDKVTKIKALGDLQTSTEPYIETIINQFVAECDATKIDNIQVLTSAGIESVVSLVVHHQIQFLPVVDVDPVINTRYLEDMMAAIKSVSTKNSGNLSIASDALRLELAKVLAGFFKTVSYNLSMITAAGGTSKPTKDHFIAALCAMTARYSAAQGKILTPIAAIIEKMDHDETQRKAIESIKTDPKNLSEFAEFMRQKNLGTTQVSAAAAANNAQTTQNMLAYQQQMGAPFSK